MQVLLLQAGRGGAVNAFDLRQVPEQLADAGIGGLGGRALVKAAGLQLDEFRLLTHGIQPALGQATPAADERSP